MTNIGTDCLKEPVLLLGALHLKDKIKKRYDGKNGIEVSFLDSEVAVNTYRIKATETTHKSICVVASNFRYGLNFRSRVPMHVI